MTEQEFWLWFEIELTHQFRMACATSVSPIENIPMTHPSTTMPQGSGGDTGEDGTDDRQTN